MSHSLDYYRTFYEIVKAGSFSKAAQNLYVSQSNVSQALSKLEEALGISLIERTTKRMKLTRAGELLFEEVAAMIEGLALTEKKIERLVHLEEGHIRIGVSDTLCKHFLMPYLAAFNKAYPKIKISLSNRPSSVSVTSLRNGEIDVAIVNVLPDMIQDDFSIRQVKSFKEVIVAPNSSPITAATPLSDLMQAPFISLEARATTRKHTDMIFMSQGYTFNPIIELSSLDLIFDFVREGFGIGIVPDYAVEPEGNFKILNLPFDVPSRTIGVMTSKQFPLNMATKKFISTLVDHSGQA